MELLEHHTQEGLDGGASSAHWDSGKVCIGGAGTSNGEKGGNSGELAWSTYTITGGAGNPNGNNYGNESISFGTGGLLIMYSKSLNGTGNIESNGSKSDDSWAATGGGSGAGSINIFTESIGSEIKNKITANGVECGGQGHGGTGGNGTVTIGDISSGSFVKK